MAGWKRVHRRGDTGLALEVRLGIARPRRERGFPAEGTTRGTRSKKTTVCSGRSTLPGSHAMNKSIVNTSLSNQKIYV